MFLFPGSDQYPLITPFQEVIPLGLLPAGNALISGEIYTVGMGRCTLLCQYAKTASQPNGEVTYVGTGAVLTLYLSPYSLASQVPAGEAEWWPVSVLKTETVAGGTVNGIIGEYGTLIYLGVALDNTLESWTLDFSLPSHAQRIKISAAEVFPAENGGTRGSFGCYALLSGDSGGEFGWTLKQQDPGSVQLVGGSAVDANLQVGDADVSNLNPVPISDNGGSLTVDGSLTVSGTVTANEGLKTLIPVSGTVAATGDVIAGPAAGSHLVIVAFAIQNEVVTAQTAQLHAEGAATEGFRLFAPADAAGYGLRMVFPAGREWRLGDAEDLELTLSAATTVGFSVLYFVEV